MNTRPNAGHVSADEELLEEVSARVHDAWMETKRSQGVTSRPSEWGEEQMVPYAELTERAKDLDRGTVRAVLAALPATPADAWDEGYRFGRLQQFDADCEWLKVQPAPRHNSRATLVGNLDHAAGRCRDNPYRGGTS